MASGGKVEQLEQSVWPKHIVKWYIDIMVEEVTKGNMKNGVFIPKVWKNILEKLNAKSQRTFNLVQIKQKFNRLRTKQREFSQLLQHTGFGWDAETNTVTANEEVWSNYIMAHPEASQFRKHGLEHYKMLGIIFNRSTATGILHHSSTQDPPNSDDEVRLDDEYINSGVHANLDKDEDNFAPDIVERVTHSGKRSIEFSDRKRKKEPRSMQMGEAIQAFAEESKARAEAHRAKAERWRSRSESSVGTPASHGCSVSACVAILNEMDLSDDIYVKAMKEFKEPINRELFMAVPLERKRAWVESL